VESTDTLNIIPFEGADETVELVWRGLHLKYLPSLRLLTAAVCFRHVKGTDEGMARIAADNSWPLLWHNIVINGSTIHSINLNSRIVCYKNNLQSAIDETINDLSIYLYLTIDYFVTKYIV